MSKQSGWYEQFWYFTAKSELVVIVGANFIVVILGILVPPVVLVVGVGVFPEGFEVAIILQNTMVKRKTFSIRAFK